MDSWQASGSRLKRKPRIMLKANMATKESEVSTMNQSIRRAMACPDDWVIAMEYIDSKGVATERLVSPVRFLSSRRFLALCLFREEPRQFYLDRCTNVRLVKANEALMPSAMPVAC